MEAGEELAPNPAPQATGEEKSPYEAGWSRANDDEGDYCRICRGEDTKEQPLFYPCKCSGSIKFVHQDCLMEWLSHSQKKYCELCKTPFRFTKLYDRRMPRTLPLPLFLRQLAFHGVNTLVRWTRFLLVGLVWLGWLPWSIRQVWRGLFWLADGSWVTLSDAEGTTSLPSAKLSSNGTSPSPTPITLFNISDTAIKEAIPQVVAPISRFLGLSGTEFLLVKIVKALCPNFFRWSSHFLSTAGSANVTITGSYVPSEGDRQPSLMSNSVYLSNITPYPTVNNAVIDILEGQLTCLLVVTAFILVFLIREWVINQQPAANMPDPDRADEVVLPPPADNGRPGPLDRHHRRGLRDVVEPRENGQVLGNDPRLEGLMPVVVPRRRRPRPVFDHDAGDGGHFRAQPQEASPAETTASPIRGSDEGTLAQSSSPDFREHPRPSGESRPTLPARNAFDEAATIRRFIEEGSNNRVRPRPTGDSQPALPARNTFEEAATIRRLIEEGSKNQEGQLSHKILVFKELWTRAEGDPLKALLILVDEEGWEEEKDWIAEVMERLLKEGDYRQDNSSFNTEKKPDEVLKDDPYPGQESLLQAIIEDNNSDKSASNSSKPNALATDAPHPTGISDTGAVINHSLLDQPRDPALSQPPIKLLQPTNTPSLPESSPESWATIGSALDIGLAQAEEPQTLIENLPSSQASSDDRATVPSPDDDAAQASENLGELHEDESPGTADNNEVGVAHQALLEPILDWFWRIDGYIPVPEDTVNQDDERLVQDLDREAPFVPVQEEAADLVAHNLEREDEPEDPEAAGRPNLLGIDLNNPEGIDEAEDIDGILELIGMQGPLTGMVQNVIFSEFLITLTIAASVWLPYIWGKIALLVLANPIAMLKAPLYLASGVVDTTVDLIIFVGSLLVYAGSFVVSQPLKLLGHLFPKVSKGITDGKTLFNQSSLSLAKGSGTRLEKTIFGTMLNLKPDLPTFSVLSHQALQIFEQRLAVAAQVVTRVLAFVFLGLPVWLYDLMYGLHPREYNMLSTVSSTARILQQMAISAFAYVVERGRYFSSDLGQLPALDTKSLDYRLARWSTQDKILAIVLGYSFFTLLGFLYLKISRYVIGLRAGEKVDGLIADGLNQAGGVMKVVLIIGIEMIVFPLYCGLLLDVALMPLFAGVHLNSRIRFLMEAPSTAIFVHWFIGTCYMFHFALFVSMCRKIMRKGVLYFIRDPDDPTFHPVRDVLERPIATQLSKIAFSALVYGGLVIMCLGGVIFALREVDGILPIHWATGEPNLELPIDLMFFNFALPFLIRRAEPSSKLHAMYEWWFRKCARTLRLTNFLFGDKKEDEEGILVRRSWSAMLPWKMSNVLTPVVGEDRRLPADDRHVEAYFLRNGKFVRAPASDSVRIPKGERVFLEVDENNERVDRLPDENDGPHGKTNKNFTRVYIPPMFRARIAAFVFAIWVFAAVTGVITTVLPLLTGRRALMLFSQSKLPPNDLYAFTAGLYLCSGVVYTIAYFRVWRNWLLFKLVRYFGNPRYMLSKLQYTISYALGIAYLAVAYGVVLPLAFSLVAELYFLVPFYTHLISPLVKDPSPTTVQYSTLLPPTIHILQTWTLGLFYLRLSLRLATSNAIRDTRASIAIRAILRNGILRPDVRLATRAFILPSMLLATFFLCTPLALGKMVNSVLLVKQPELQSSIYRYAYPGLLAGALLLYFTVRLKRQVSVWRIRIRDEVYLIGERLHNFGESKRRPSKGKQRANTISERVDMQGLVEH